MDQSTKLVELLIILMCAFWVLGFFFCICELGETITHRFDVFRQELERCNWHTLPIEMQRMFLIFLLDTQQPINIRCYGNVTCLRDTFRKVTKQSKDVENTRFERCDSSFPICTVHFRSFTMDFHILWHFDISTYHSPQIEALNQDCLRLFE